MAIVEQTIKRVFKYNGITLQDPGPEKLPDQVRVLFAPAYPELLNAVVEGPVTKSGVSTYTFARATGSKGVAYKSAMQKIFTDGMPNTGSPLDGVSISHIKENQKCSQIVSAVVNNRTKSTPALPVAAAFSRLG